MPEEKDKKKSFSNIIFKIVIGFFIIFMLAILISMWFFGFQPTYNKTFFFQNYYNQSRDSRYEWAK